MDEVAHQLAMAFGASAEHSKLVCCTIYHYCLQSLLQATTDMDLIQQAFNWPQEVGEICRRAYTM